MDTDKLISLKYDEQDIKEKRNIVRKELLNRSENINSGEIKKASPKDLELLFDLYDQVFFYNYFKESFSNPLNFSLSSRMSRSAGKTKMTKSLINPNTPISYEIVMAVNFFFKYEELNREKKVNGINTTDALHAFQLVFEHEMCHLIEYHLFKSSNCKAVRFKTLVHNFFRHTDVYHQLPTNREIAAKVYGFKAGEHVTFSYEGKTYTGIIQAINKRATVMVKDKKGAYADNKGNRYTKWYVPLLNLTISKK